MANYRHPAPRRGGPCVVSAGAFLDSGGSAGSGGSGGEFLEGTDDCKNTIHRAIFFRKMAMEIYA